MSDGNGGNAGNGGGGGGRPARDPLTVDRLRMIRELARRGTIAATARALGLTPSAVSQQLSALEREAGLALIDRADRRATLTPAGHALVEHADRVLDALAAASAELDRVRGAVGGPFRIATVPSAAPALVSPVIARLRVAHPDLDVTVIDEEPHRSLDHLDRGTIDLAVVDRYAAAPLPLEADLDARALLVEPLLAVLPVGHPALGRRSGPVALADLAGDDWIVAPDEVSCGAAVRSACRAAGFEPRVRWQTDDLILHLEHVAAGHGVALLPRLGVRAGVAGIEVRPLAPPAVTRELLAVTRSAAVARPAVAAVLTALTDAAEAAPAA
ncbi:MAG TPA: LysR substrate-binding domain-containing protein [Iamia sp.]|nr:LysR substrate-binding domain-containing protein [Iamia sp.]